MSFQEAADQDLVLFLRRHGVFPSADLSSGGIISPKPYPARHANGVLWALFPECPEVSCRASHFCGAPSHEPRYFGSRYAREPTLVTENTAPWGSARTAVLPTEVAKGDISTPPPSSATLSAATSTSSTQKSTL